MFNAAVFVPGRGNGGGPPPGDSIWEHGSGGVTSAQTIGTGCDASGIYSIAENELTIASGEASLAHGILTEASGANAEAGGEFAIASGIDSYCRGSNSMAIAELSEAIGAGAVSYLFGSKVFATGEYSNFQIGTAQRMEMLLRTQTTDDTPTELFLNWLTTGTQVMDPLLAGFDNVIWKFEINAIGLHAATGDCFSKTVKGTFKSIGGVATILNATILAGDEESDAAAATWDLVVQVDPGNTYLQLLAVGEVAKNIQWMANVVIQQSASN